jgi:hypothetical protein
MYTDPAHTKAMTPEALEVVMQKHAAIGEEAEGEIVGGVGMAAPEETATLRLGAEGVEASSGPFKEGREQLSAYYELEVTTEQRALEIASNILDDHVTAVELRAIHDSAPRRDWS